MCGCLPYAVYTQEQHVVKVESYNALISC